MIVQHCTWMELQHWHGAVNMIISLLYETLIKLPLILFPAACRRILLATLGMNYTEEFSGLNKYILTFICLVEIHGVMFSFKVRNNDIHVKYLVWCDLIR